MSDKEPIYDFKPGTGWVPSTSPRLLTKDDFVNWGHREHPDICYGPGWVISNVRRKDTKIGDIIPFTGVCGVVTRVTDDFIYLTRYSRTGVDYKDKMINDGTWYDLARYVG